MRRRHIAWWAIAAALALAGVAAVLVRPLAPDLPPVTTTLDAFDGDVLAAVREYRSDRYALTAVVAFVSVAVPAIFVLTSFGRRLVALSARRLRRRSAIAAAVAAMIALATAVAELPLAYWVSYVRERRWGFATASSAEWLRDWAVVVGFVLIVAVVGAVVFVWARHRWADTWHLRLVVAGTGLTALLTLGYPLLVQPLLLPTQELGPGPVHDAVTAVLERAGAEDVDVLVGDASRRTTKVNAFVTGIGPSRQLVLFDTLLELPAEDVAVVVAHELAHREHRDVPRAVLASATGFFLGVLLLRRVVDRGGEDGKASDARAVAVLALFLAAGQIVAAPVTSWSSRRAEAAADHRALELTRAPTPFISTQRTFVVRDLADPSPPDWVTVLWGTHPTISERIRAAVAFAEANGIELPSREEFERDEPTPPEPRAD